MTSVIQIQAWINLRITKSLVVFEYRGKGLKTTFLQTLNLILAHFPLVERNIRLDGQFVCINDTHVLN